MSRRKVKITKNHYRCIFIHSPTRLHSWEFPILDRLYESGHLISEPYELDEDSNILERAFFSSALSYVDKNRRFIQPNRITLFPKGVAAESQIDGLDELLEDEDEY